MGPNDPLNQSSESSSRRERANQEDESPGSSAQTDGRLRRRFDLKVASISGALVGASFATAWVFEVVAEVAFIMLFGLLGATIGAGVIYALKEPERIRAAWGALRGGST